MKSSRYDSKLNLPYLIIGICLMALAGLTGWYIGKEEGREEGSASARSSMQAQVDDANSRADNLGSQYIGLEQEYQKLTESYDNLYNSAQNYVLTQRYVPPKTYTTCNSYSYGMNSISTTCY